jgi:ParB-like chromosome segregation protein Spo0J
MMQPSDLLPFHPLSKTYPFPLLNGVEFNDLVDDIKANGLREPITLYEGKILDGCNRYRACLKAKVEHRFEQFEGNDAAALAFVSSKNIHRRHLKAKERRDAIAKLLKNDPNKSDRQISKEIGVSNTHVGKVRKELEKSGDVSTVDTRTDTKDREQPAKKHKRPANNPQKNRQHTAAKAGSQVMPGQIGPVMEFPKPAETAPAPTVSDELITLRRLNGALTSEIEELKEARTRLESEIEELKAENAKLRAQACARARNTKKPPYFESEANPISN